ncbi:MAG: EAL domain-containing protein, partial [Comamonas sp.]|nr:EAL domain-containing protein [Candidatus Comamonas equi]
MTSATFQTLSAPSLPEGVADDSVSMIGRQAILNEQREVFGYELFDRNTAAAAHTAASDAALLFNALSYAGTEALVGRKLVFINCTHESLVGGHLELIHPEKVVLEIPVMAETATAEEIQSRLPIFEALRQRGFRLAFDQNLLRRAYASWLPMASFIKLDMLTFPLSSAEALVKFSRT